MNMALLVTAIAVTIGFTVLAKHGGRGRRSNALRGYRKLQVTDTLSVGALASADVISAAWPDVITEKRWFSSMVATWAMEAHTTLEGPITVGIAHSDYSAAEIEEWLENAAGWDEGDLVADREVGRRLIRRVGQFDGVPVDEVLNDGKPIRTKIGWLIATGDTLQTWAFNRDTGPLTTGTIIVLDGHVNSWAR